MMNKWIVLVIATSLVMSELSGGEMRKNNHQVARSTEHKNRQTRGALLSQPLGFFGKIAYVGGLLFQQYNDTSNAFRQLRDILQDQFSDTATKSPPTKKPTSTSSTSEPAETTTEKYRISRKEFGQIINRNMRGLQKLFRIELADSKNQSLYTIAEYKQQLKDQIKPRGGILNKHVNLTVSNSNSL